MANMILLDEGRVTMGEGCAAAKGQEPGNKGMCGILCCEGVKKEQGRQKGREKAGRVFELVRKRGDENTRGVEKEKMRKGE